MADVFGGNQNPVIHGTVGLLPANLQGKLIKWKRKWLKNL